MNFKQERHIRFKGTYFSLTLWQFHCGERLLGDPVVPLEHHLDGPEVTAAPLALGNGRHHGPDPGSRGPSINDF